MSISSELTNLAANRDAIKAAIEAKNPETAPTSALSSFPASIASIPTGGGSDGGWQKPSDWPDIEQILADDVTPQAAIDLGATKKWICLFSPGVVRGNTKSVSFYSPVVYLRCCIGGVVSEQSSLTLPEVPDGGGLYWAIAYSSSDLFIAPGPFSNPYNERALLWLHAPGMRLRWSDTAEFYQRNLVQRICFGSIAEKNANSRVQCPNMRSFVCADGPEAGISSLSGMFSVDAGEQARMYVLSEVGAAGWSVGSVTDMSYMFQSCMLLEKLDVSGWDTGKVTNMSSMFQYCEFIKSIDVSRWDTGNVTNMTGMFQYCYSLESLDVSRWDTGKVMNMSSMFHNCRALSSLDVSGWDTGALTNLTGMFQYCVSLQSLDVSGWNLSSVSRMSSMFASCFALHSLIGLRSVENDGTLSGTEEGHGKDYFGKGPKVAFGLNQSESLNRDSLLFLMYWVADLNGGSATMTLGSTNTAKLSASEISIATAKGWTVA